MKISHAPSSIEKETDTDKLADVEAEILEAAEHLRDLCSKYRRQLLISVNAADKSGKNMMFWSFLSERMSPAERGNVDGKVHLLPEEVQEFFSNLNYTVELISNGKFRIISMT